MLSSGFRIVDGLRRLPGSDGLGLDVRSRRGAARSGTKQIRNHRSGTTDQEPQIRNHRSDQEPQIRNHRSGTTDQEPQIRNHRSGTTIRTQIRNHSGTTDPGAERTLRSNAVSRTSVSIRINPSGCGCRNCQKRSETAGVGFLSLPEMRIVSTFTF